MKKMIGITLLEVLISMLILSMVLLGFDVLELDAMQYLRRAFFFNIATEQLYSLIEILESHSEIENHNQIKLWNKNNKTLLPEGNSHVVETHPVYEVSLFWGEKTTLKKCPVIQKGRLQCLNWKITT